MFLVPFNVLENLQDTLVPVIAINRYKSHSLTSLSFTLSQRQQDRKKNTQLVTSLSKQKVQSPLS